MPNTVLLKDGMLKPSDKTNKGDDVIKLVKSNTPVCITPASFDTAGKGWTRAYTGKVPYIIIETEHTWNNLPNNAPIKTITLFNDAVVQPAENGGYSLTFEDSHRLYLETGGVVYQRISHVNLPKDGNFRDQYYIGTENPDVMGFLISLL